MRKERERAEEARLELRRGSWEQKCRDRWCERECRDILSGFEDVCDGLRREMERSGAAAASVATAAV